MSEKIVFTANLAGLNTAAKWLAVDSDGASKIVLEASATELASVMRLAILAKTSLRVTVEPEVGQPTAQNAEGEVDAGV